jgi:hypothetical protein
MAIIIYIFLILLGLWVGVKLLQIFQIVGHWVNVGAGKVHARKDLKNLDKSLKSTYQQFQVDNNYLVGLNEDIRQKAVDNASVICQRVDYQDKTTELLRQSLSFFKTRYPLADEQLLIEYSKQFFLGDVDELRALENQIKDSHTICAKVMAKGNKLEKLEEAFLYDDNY